MGAFFSSRRAAAAGFLAIASLALLRSWSKSRSLKRRLSKPALSSETATEFLDVAAIVLPHGPLLNVVKTAVKDTGVLGSKVTPFVGPWPAGLNVELNDTSADPAKPAKTSRKTTKLCAVHVSGSCLLEARRLNTFRMLTQFSRPGGSVSGPPPELQQLPASVSVLAGLIAICVQQTLKLRMISIQTDIIMNFSPSFTLRPDCSTL
jgi:hypothetical protein